MWQVYLSVKGERNANFGGMAGMGKKELGNEKFHDNGCMQIQRRNVTE